MDLVAGARDVQQVERLHGRLRLAFGRAERGEVMLADKALRRGVHRLNVEPARHTPRALALQCEIGAAVDDAVEIMALLRRETRVEAVGGFFRGENRDRMRPQM